MPNLRALPTALTGLLLLLGFGGCATDPREKWGDLDEITLTPMPVSGEEDAAPLTRVEFPMKLIGGLVVVEADDEGGPWNFLIDTGSSATLVSPEFAIRRRSRLKPPDNSPVWLRDASGSAVPVESVLLEKIDFGPAHFRSVRALVYDCSVISDHLGIKIDGVLGFQLFNDARLTLDYPGRRIVMSEHRDPTPLRGQILPFSYQNGVPMIEATIDNHPILALIDSGSDGSLNLDPAGHDLGFAVPPRPGTQIGTLHGNHRQIMARLEGTLQLGDFVMVQPVVDLSGLLTSLGGDMLQHFELTFDQRARVVAWYRTDGTVPLPSPPKLSSGLSFSKVRAYWRVTAVAPDSPAQAAGCEEGDLVIRINGEPVEDWDLNRYHELVDAGTAIDYTFLRGRDEETLSIAIFELVP